ncbi:MAG: hypothetical protein EBU70_14935, partial [Actinobacteria bacterium]|nr:hypothetical protein [Actinomycetota bacterium]
MPVTVPAFVEARRSIRAFAPEPVDRATLDALVTAACLAPAPHHSRPWRFVVVDTPAGKADLARGMGEQWRRDLGADGVDPARIDGLVEASRVKLTTAPALVLGCLTWDGLDRYPAGGWLLLTIIVITQPSVHGTYRHTLDRAAGTFAGVLAAGLIGLWLGESHARVVIALGLLVIAFAFMQVPGRYWAYVLFLT